MKRSFLSRRLSRRSRLSRLSRSARTRTRSARIRTRSARTRSHKHPRYHRSSSRRMTRRLRLKKRGGAIGETVAEVEGIPVGRNVVVTNAKGVTRSLEEHNPLLNADTAGEFGDDI